MLKYVKCSCVKKRTAQVQSSVWGRWPSWVSTAPSSDWSCQVRLTQHPAFRLLNDANICCDCVSFSTAGVRESWPFQTLCHSSCALGLAVRTAWPRTFTTDNVRPRRDEGRGAFEWDARPWFFTASSCSVESNCGPAVEMKPVNPLNRLHPFSFDRLFRLMTTTALHPV